MATTNDSVTGDPIVSFNFEVDAGGMLSGFFSSVTGLGGSMEVAEHLVVGMGGAQEIVRKIPARYEGGEITLERAITTNKDAWTWRKMVEDGNVDGARQNGSIVMYDETGSEVARWNFEAAWPSKIETDSLDSGGNTVTMEKITLVFEYIERVT